jgi:uncharacterized cupredoxin-like copper-binding protein
MPPVIRQLRLPLAAAACVAGLASLATAVAGAQSHAAPSSILVTLTDSKIKLGSTKAPLGSVTFKVVNKGKLPRDFKIGSKKTSKIAAGKSATLNVDFALTGQYSYYSNSKGQALTLSGVLDVVDPCTHPTVSAVTVGLAEEPISLSVMTIPCGTVTFTVTNTGTIIHSFNITGDGLEGQGPRMNPGQTIRMTVHFSYKGRAIYYCAEEEHGELYGMAGSIMVV